MCSESSKPLLLKATPAGPPPALKSCACSSWCRALQTRALEQLQTHAFLDLDCGTPQAHNRSSVTSLLAILEVRIVHAQAGEPVRVPASLLEARKTHARLARAHLNPPRGRQGGSAAFLTYEPWHCMGSEFPRRSPVVHS